MLQNVKVIQTSFFSFYSFLFFIKGRQVLCHNVAITIRGGKMWKYFSQCLYFAEKTVKRLKRQFFFPAGLFLKNQGKSCYKCQVA